MLKDRSTPQGDAANTGSPPHPPSVDMSLALVPSGNNDEPALGPAPGSPIRMASPLRLSQSPILVRTDSDIDDDDYEPDKEMLSSVGTSDEEEEAVETDAQLTDDDSNDVDDEDEDVDEEDVAVEADNPRRQFEFNVDAKVIMPAASGTSKTQRKPESSTKALMCKLLKLSRSGFLVYFFEKFKMGQSYRVSTEGPPFTYWSPSLYVLLCRYHFYSKIS
ncbi:hypothetical protein AURDEDRAFT_176000 [Auricularia subglabra TFB-10046 SS5]|nr:hypothetical protein AURDEDRAFT_176000 [Auricularia subglabra TFB-10046 SS5]